LLCQRPCCNWRATEEGWGVTDSETDS
jgi:hypothetical protein